MPIALFVKRYFLPLWASIDKLSSSVVAPEFVVKDLPRSVQAVWLVDVTLALNFFLYPDLTSSLNTQWRIKIKKPCSEFSRAKIYANASVASLKARIPNIHVSPSKGSNIMHARIPDLIFSLSVLSAFTLTPINARRTNIKTQRLTATMLITGPTKA